MIGDTGQRALFQNQPQRAGGRMASAKGKHLQVALDAIQGFQRAVTAESLNAAVSSSIARYGYRYHCFASAQTPQRRVLEQRKLLISWPADWYRQYGECKLVEHDVVAASFRTRATSFRWSDLNIETAASRRVMQIASEDFAMKKGFAVPIFGLGGYEAGLSVAGAEVEETDEANSAIELMAVYAFNQLTRIKSRGREVATVLRPREREVMQWVAAGKTTWDIGAILNISSDTVNKTIGSAMRRLEVHTRAQAVSEALRRREIEI
jgi:LuxR family quorum sensing-dependent transcriptional regulator